MKDDKKWHDAFLRIICGLLETLSEQAYEYGLPNPQSLRAIAHAIDAHKTGCCDSYILQTLRPAVQDLCIDEIILDIQSQDT